MALFACLTIVFCTQGHFGAKVKNLRQIFSFENLSTLTPQTSAAYSTYKTASSAASSLSSYSTAPTYKTDPKESGIKIGPFAFGGMGEKAKAAKAEQEKSEHGVESGWGTYGKKGEMEARLKGYVIAKPGLVVEKP